MNRDVVVLNDLSNGNAWLVDSDLRLVDNWEEVTPPEETDELEGDEKSAQQTFEDTLAERTDVNRPPLARDDEAGVRPGRTTVLEVLENDTDPDGDVLTVAETSEVAASQGRLEVIDGGRALQLTPADGAAGTISFRYSVEDGRSGVSEASVDVRIVPETENVAPTSLRSGAVSVEQGQQISYNVLADWNDPDGDDVFLVNASPTSGDSVRFSPDGYVTFDHKSGELGLKEVAFTVSDGQLTATGTLTVDVKPAGTLNPVGTPDFAQVFAGEATLIEPLENDLTPSGAPLALLGVDQVPTGASVTPNPERGTIAFSSNEPGEYIFLYNVGADAAVSVGLVRVQVVEPPAEAPPPIAVKDTAYLRPGEPTSVPVLANDVSPSGRVLAVQSADDTETDDLVSVEILTNTVARVTASEALDRQLQFSYTISDGVNTATATVTVVPVPPLVKHQPPVAVDDAVNVRAGDIATVPVLANDYHPDSTAIHVLPELADTGALQGLAFVDDDHVRFQAPDEPGTYTAVYTIGDDFEQTARANVTFTVVAKDAGENRPPLPTPLTSRTFAGSAVSIDIPLDGLDPDGDSVVLTGISSAPNLGRIAERTSTSITYEAFAGSTGTDTFGYELRDAFGATAKGTIRIGVIPRPAVALPPKAVDDAIEVKPGRTASVEVLLNDSDPSGYSLKAVDLPEVDEGIEAEIRDKRRVVVTAPDQEGAFTIRYEISNGHGGADTAFLQVAVKDDAKVLPPTAEDQVIEPEEVVEVDSVTVQPLDDATNPGGLVDDLVVTLEGPNAGRAEVTPDGGIVVKPGRERYAVAYRLTNELDELSAMAFVIVPPSATEEDIEEDEPTIPAPHLAELDPIVVPMNGSIRWDVADLVVVPSGKPALVLSASAANARSEAYVDGSTLRYEPAQDYRGEASVTFEVTDGRNADDPEGRKALLTVPVTVGDPDFEDTPPVLHPACRDDRGGGAAARDRPALLERPPEPRRHRTARVLEPRRHDRRRPGRHRRGRAAGLRAARRAAGHGHATHVRRDVQRVHGAGLRRREGRVVDPGEGAGRRRRSRLHEAQRDHHDRRARERLQPVPRRSAEGDRCRGRPTRRRLERVRELHLDRRLGAHRGGLHGNAERDLPHPGRDEGPGPRDPGPRDGDRARPSRAAERTGGHRGRRVRRRALAGPRPEQLGHHGLRGELQRAGRHLRRGRRRHHPAHHRTRQRHRVHLRRARDQRHRRLGVVGGHDRDALWHADGPAERAAHLLGKRPGRPHRELERPGLDGRRRGRLPVARHGRPGLADHRWHLGSRERRGRRHVHARGASDQPRQQPDRPDGLRLRRREQPAAPAARRVHLQGRRRQGGGNAVVVRYENFTSGGHRMYTSLNGDSSAFYKETFGIGGDGKQTLQNWLGVRFDSAIWVEIEGPTSISKTNSITGDRWNSLSPGQCSG